MSNISIFGTGGTGPGSIPATANLNFYVSPTGSDSNPGTIVAPFATIQHAVNVASLYNYQGAFFPKINVSAGTINMPNIVVLPSLVNLGGPPFGTITFGFAGVIQGQGVTSTRLYDANNNGAFTATGGGCSWIFDALTIDSIVQGLVANAGAALGTFANGTIGFDQTNVPGVATCVMAFLDGLIQLDQSTITIRTTNVGQLVNASAIAFVGQPGGAIVITNSTINLPAANYGSGLYFFDTYAINTMELALWQLTFVNGASWQGGSVRAGGGGIHSFITTDGTFSSFPGGGAVIADVGVNVCASSFQTNRTSWYSNQISGLPPTTSIAPQQWGVFADTSGHGKYIAYNDAGTIIQTILGPKPGLVAALPTPGVVNRKGFVTDATVTTFASIVAGGGANAVPVYDDGTNWRIG